MELFRIGLTGLAEHCLGTPAFGTHFAHLLVVLSNERAKLAETMRGMRLGAQSLESDSGVELSARQRKTFRCAEGHEFVMVFSETAELPEVWDCKSCPEVAIRLENDSPITLTAGESEAPRTHYDMVLERRSREELEELLQEMLADMRARRAAGRLSA